MFYITITTLLLLITFSISLDSKANSDKSTSPNLKYSLPKHLEKQDPKGLWGKLFGISRATNCAQTMIFQKLVKEVLAYNKFGANVSKFYWVKEWGFGPASYFFDYLDAILQKEMVTEFKLIHNAVKKEKKADTSGYSDSLDMNRQMANADPASKYKYAKLIKEYNNKIKSSYFHDAVNTVQLNSVMQKLGWHIQNPTTDFAKDFVLSYDIDGDGRLNARELILGAIRNNADNFDYKTCKFCFKKVIAIIDTMFKFFNCAETGFVDAEQLWKGLPELLRHTNKYNIFGIKNSLSIRTNSINDFVLKNEGTKDAFLTLKEFRQGILLGFWDRQTTESGIIDGDSRNLKKLRWSDDGMKDTYAYNYMKQTVILELQRKAEERKEAMVKHKQQTETK